MKCSKKVKNLLWPQITFVLIWVALTIFSVVYLSKDLIGFPVQFFKVAVGLFPLLISFDAFCIIYTVISVVCIKRAGEKGTEITKRCNIKNFKKTGEAVLLKVLFYLPIFVCLILMLLIYSPKLQPKGEKLANDILLKTDSAAFIGQESGTAVELKDTVSINDLFIGEFKSQTILSTAQNNFGSNGVVYNFKIFKGCPHEMIKRYYIRYSNNLNKISYSYLNYTTGENYEFNTDRTFVEYNGYSGYYMSDGNVPAENIYVILKNERTLMVFEVVYVDETGNTQLNADEVKKQITDVINSIENTSDSLDY